MGVNCALSDSGACVARHYLQVLCKCGVRCPVCALDIELFSLVALYGLQMLHATVAALMLM